ncbi:MAG TPA: hypothetical protein VE684_11590, partial [Crenalkalicoccus sp.]|nr:hypothetical protein [Crenalkalicoccus sp.]
MPGTERDRPRLRIETGAHQGRVLGCDIDYAGTLLLTAGDDRTARLWSVPELRPLGVLRPPFGETPDGSLYAAALSPDGSMGVVAGYAAGPLCLHVFDVARCEIVHRVKLTEAGGESVATLRFSPDGELLAVGTGGLGLILFATAGWRHIGADAAYGARVTGLDFTTEGDRLAVASEDGVVRLYDRKALAGAARPSLQAETSAGRLAASIRFAPPDGETLALGFEDGGLELRGARDLALRASRMPERLVGNTSVPSVAWSADGASLFAAGNTCFVENEWVVLRADARGTGPWQPMRDHLRTNIGYLRDVPGAGCLVVTRGGEIALYGSDGARRAEVLPPQGDVRADHEAADPAARTFCLSYGGTLVEWTTATRWRGFRFDALNLELKSAPLPPPFGLAGWNSALGEVRVEGWDGGENPTLHTADGRRVPLELGPGERAQSVDLHHGKLLLGASFGLRRFAMADGTLLVHRPIDQAAWRVNQSQDGRLTVAALYDGTIRWYRAEDLEELLAVFVTDEPSPRWVAFTPDGWYAAGAGAEELIGWHLDRGEGRSAAFFPASAFRERFHRPDLVRRVLRTRDPAEALRQADAARGDAPTPPPEQQLAALHG